MVLSQQAKEYIVRDAVYEYAKDEVEDREGDY